MAIGVRLVFGCFLLAGCAFNHHAPTGSVVYLKNDSDTGRAIRLTVMGIHLATDSIDAGLHVGHIQQTLFFPGGQSQANDRGMAMFSNSDQDNLLKPVDEAEGEQWQLGSPLAASTRRVGVGLGWSSGIHFHLGLDQRARLALPARSSMIVVHKQHVGLAGSSHSSGVHFTVQEYAP